MKTVTTLLFALFVGIIANAQASNTKPPRDALCNRAFDTLEQMEAAITQWLQEFWRDTRNVSQLIGRGWLWNQANAS